ncbi:hypothetical protein I4U23_007664 [Adineta vaga]|nr:hypothetical protein I4U23_007664 [Adineta vaga]
MNTEVSNSNDLALDAIDIKKTSDDIEPTAEELNTLEHISDRLPLVAWLIVLCELCERFAYYGISGPFQNYIQFPVPGPNDTQPGALDRGHQTATLLTTFFQFFCYLTPIAGAIIADQFWGKYKTICVACMIYIMGLLILVLTSIPNSIKTGFALPGLVIAMIVIGIGTGGVKSNVSPLMADQYTRKTPIIKGTMNSFKKDMTSIQHLFFISILEIRGKKKIIDPKM